jgi:hypothetical protein
MIHLPCIDLFKCNEPVALAPLLLVYATHSIYQALTFSLHQNSPLLHGCGTTFFKVIAR